jgi:uncharacterized FlaG/YvyC family protein
MDVTTLTGSSSVAAGSSAAVTVVPDASAVQSATATLPIGGATSSSTPEVQPRGISPAIAKIFGSGAPLPKGVTLNVSYRIDHNPDEIVIVFTDPKTGKEVAQFPPELFAQLAGFLDHQQGATLDENA